MSEYILEFKQDISATFAETYKESLFRFLDMLKLGNTKNAQVFLHDFSLAGIESQCHIFPFIKFTAWQHRKRRTCTNCLFHCI